MFLDEKQYPFTALLEENYPVIRQELEQVALDRFQAWPDRYLYGQPKQRRYGAGWEVFGLYEFAKKNEANCRLCPVTTRVVEAIPGLTTAGFSRLEPGTHIKPHVGYTTSVLRCHLGLVVPEGCALRVGPEVRPWREGKTMVFDDTTEHEAWNRSDDVRIVLLLDFLKEGHTFTPPEALAAAAGR
jgi:beta-hydroxylase